MGILCFDGHILIGNHAKSGRLAFRVRVCGELEKASDAQLTTQRQQDKGDYLTQLKSPQSL